MPILDTNFLIALQDGDEGARALLRELSGESLIVPPWVVVEFLTGHTAKPETVVDELDRAFTLAETDRRWAMEAARFRKELRRKGAKIRLPDFWIATFARLHETSVVTKDVRHFAALGVRTRAW